MHSETMVPANLRSAQCGREDSQVNEQLKFTMISAVGGHGLGVEGGGHTI